MMLVEFQEIIEYNFSFLPREKLIVACSGGADSVTLVHLCHKLNMDFAIAHCNFNLRGSESDGDQKLVEELAKKTGVQIFLKSFDTIKYKNQGNRSVQMAARELRYKWLAELILCTDYTYVLTAHHADDVLETFLINLSRGTGIKGLSGIVSHSGTIVRPLLTFSSAEIRKYAKINNLKWREDSSNSETKYVRNKLRLEVIPKLKEIHPAFMDNFFKTQQFLKESVEFQESGFKEIKKRLFKKDRKTGIISINIERLKSLTPLDLHLYHLFSEYGFNQWKDIRRLLDGLSGKFIISDTHRLLRNRSDLLLESTSSTEDDSSFFIFSNTLEINDPISLVFSDESQLGEKDKTILYVDKKQLKFPLQLRKYKKGDLFYPFGMEGKKKLSKFFKDEKYSLPEKRDQWLLCSRDDIVWVVGKRADRRFQVTEETKIIYKIRLDKKV